MYIEIKEGQVWSYKARDGEQGSTLTVFKVGDAVNDVHISVYDLKIKSKTAPNGFLTDIEHLPISLNAILKSVIEQVDKKQVSLNEGYSYWHSEFVAGKAGVWDISVAEAIELIEQAQQ